MQGSSRLRPKLVQVQVQAQQPPPAPRPVVPIRAQADNQGTINSVNAYESAQPIHRGLALHDSLVYAYSTTFHSKSGAFSLTIRSPGVRREQNGSLTTHDVPIFGMRDVIGGAVNLRAPPGLGTLTITMEGALYYSSPAFSKKFADKVANPLRHKHVFLSSSFIFVPGCSTASSTSVNTTATSHSSTLGSALKRALSSGKRREGPANDPNARPRFEMPATQQIARSFSFQIPNRVGQEIPPSFYASVLTQGRKNGVRERASVESAEVEYKLSAVWESATGRRISVEAPFSFLPDPIYTAPRRPLQWSETPLSTSRPLPFKCALSLPHPRTFMRGPDGSMPFHVIFATDPPSRSLARDIASDAVITVSLARSVTFDPSRGVRTTYSTAANSSSVASTTTSSKTSAGSSSILSGLKRMATIPPRRSHAPRVEPVQEEPPPRMREKPLPVPPPDAATTDMGILQTIVLNGFTPAQSASASKHKSSSARHGHTREGTLSGPGILFTPDGSCKGKIDLSREALPTLGYGGLSVKYVVSVSVRFGGDELHTAVDVKIAEPVARWERGETIQHGQTPVVFS